VSLGTPNTMVRAVQKSRAAYALAEVGKRHRRAKAYVEPKPMAPSRRMMVYGAQRDGGALTPAQRRRYNKKARPGLFPWCGADTACSDTSEQAQVMA
jgi:hypothetical protein